MLRNKKENIEVMEEKQNLLEKREIGYIKLIKLSF